MLFLGAGASKAVDIGDLKEITKKVNTKLVNNGYGNILDYVTETLNNANKDNQFFEEGEIDIEVILSVLNGIINPIESLKNLGPYAIYLNELKDKGQFKQDYFDIKKNNLNDIRKIVETEITELCIRYRRDIAKSYYDKLFGYGDSTISLKTATGGETKLPRIFSQIVTTNYDMVLEEYRTEINNRAYERGFKDDAIKDEKYLAIDDIFFEDKEVRKIEYLKLHGSIDWWIRDSDQRVVKRESPYTYGTEKYSGQLMVYPIYEKYVSLEPFFSMFSYFRSMLYVHDIYVVIGYSFRDPAINNAFSDMLRKKAESRIVIVNPNTDRIKKRIVENFPQKKIDVIRRCFGDDNMISELNEILLKTPSGFN